MIVRNEESVMPRLIESVAHIVDAYVICDTGSTDKTVSVIQECFAKYPHIQGRIIHIPFKNFGYNRTEALRATRGMGDYALLVDADMKISTTMAFNKSALTESAYLITQHEGGMQYAVPRLVKTTDNLVYIGYTHECINVDATKAPILSSLTIQHVGDGGCKADKFARDLRLLQQQLDDGVFPDRSMFYMANTYWDIFTCDKAMEWYLKRIAAGGWYEEVWFSHYRIGLCYQKMNDMPNAIRWWLKAYQFYNGRAENIFAICKHYQETSQPTLAWQYFKLGRAIPFPAHDVLFIESDVYTWKFDWLYSIFAMYLIGPDGVTGVTDKSCPCHRAAIMPVYKKLLDDETMPNQALLKINMQFYTQPLKNLLPSWIALQTLQPGQDGLPIGFHASTPSIVKLKHNAEVHGADVAAYLVNVRYVNYTLSRDGGYTVPPQITSINHALWMNADFIVIKTRLFQDPPTSIRYRGVEDVRLFMHKKFAHNESTDNEAEHDIWFTGTTQRSQHGLRVSLGAYRPSVDATAPCGSLLDTSAELDALDGRTCEKNWVLFHSGSCGDQPELYILSDWYPMRYAPVLGAQMDCQPCNWIVKKTPFLFSHFRGSTHGYTWGSDIYFVVHIVADICQPRRYYHVLVVLDAATMDIQQVSVPFTFQGQAIEYCLGLIVDNERIIMSYSTWDSNPKIAIYNRQSLMDCVMRPETTAHVDAGIAVGDNDAPTMSTAPLITNPPQSIPIIPAPLHDIMQQVSGMAYNDRAMWLQDQYKTAMSLAKWKHAQYLLDGYELSDVTEALLQQSNELITCLQKNGTSIVVTTNPQRVRMGGRNELVICYGNYPLDVQSLPTKSVMKTQIRRHIKFFFKDGIKHDHIEYDSIWESVEQIYIIGLESREDRFLATALEIAKLHGPLHRIHKYIAAPVLPQGDCLHMARTRNHLEVMEDFQRVTLWRPDDDRTEETDTTDGIDTTKTLESHNGALDVTEYGYAMILEDDFCWHDDQAAILNQLDTFFTRAYDFHICFMGVSKFHRKEPLDDLLMTSKQECTTSSGYIVHASTLAQVYSCSKEGFDKMVSTQDYHNTYIDRYWSRLSNLVYFRYKLGFQRAGFRHLSQSVSNSLD
jgi:glycosyltransferase involved in cell wall biosynthesis